MVGRDVQEVSVVEITQRKYRIVILYFSKLAYFMSVSNL